MSNTTLELLDTYIGMPGTMQGGYIAGLAAGDSDGPIRVRIRRPLHPGESVVRTVEDGKTVVHRGDELVMAASNSPLHVAAQAPIARDKIDAAMGRPMGWDPPIRIALAAVTRSMVWASAFVLRRRQACCCCLVTRSSVGRRRWCYSERIHLDCF